MSTFTIARLTFLEATRRKILLAALLLGLLFLIIYGLGFHFLIVEAEMSVGNNNLLQLNEIRNFLLMAGMFVVNFLTSIMIVLTSVDTLSGEISSGTIQTLASKPIRRWEIVMGKWLGFAGMLTLYLLLMGGGVMVIVFLRTGYTAPHPLRALELIWLNGLVLLSVSILGGTILSTLANGVLVFGLYGIAFLGGWIEQIGSFLPNQAASHTAVNIGIITSLIMPSEALWKRAAHELQSPLVAALGFSPFSSAYYPSLLMVVYAALYTVITLTLAVLLFNQRDL
ncbi:MAG TPA: ABC transporter permease [Anaerolineales bacterium]|nr:ABC transporter permease [Anaerolineales bacterium]